jgi:hypothetical protein
VKSKRRVLVIGALLLVWLGISACSCSTLIDDFRNQKLGGAATAIPTVTARVTPAVEPTPQSALPSATATRAVTVAPGPTSASPAVTVAADQSFVLELTEQDLANYLLEGSLQQDVRVQEANVVITEQEIICTMQVAHVGLGIASGVTLRGAPVVDGGRLFFKVNDVTLDQSLSGFARLIAQGAIEAAIKDYSEPQGIPLPVEGMIITGVKLQPGKLLVEGRQG